MGEFILSIIKVVAAIALVPIIIGSYIAFQSHLEMYPTGFQDQFLAGIIIFLMVFLFLYQFWGIYEFGQKVMQSLTAFAEPFNHFIARLIPFYLTVTMLIFYIVRNIADFSKFENIFVLLAGFFLAMHITLTAQELREEEKTPIKPNYLFDVALIFILNIFLIVLLFDLVFEKFIFPRFFDEMFAQAKDLYQFSFDKILK